MQVRQAIKGRRSVRRFTDQPIEKGALQELLDAARWAPTAANQQRCRFVVVDAPRQKELVRRFAPGVFTTPAAFVVICIEKDPNATPSAERTYLADCAIAAHNIMLAAYELGIGSCIAQSYSKAAIAQLLNIPDGIEPMFLVTLGYPAEAPQPPPRQELHQIAFINEYGNRWRE